MKKVFYIIILFSFSRHALGQTNLVPNGNFETYTTCPNNSSQIYFASPWTGPNNSTDYYNSCSTNIYFTVPYRQLGDYQLARSGNGYGGFIAYNCPGSNDREYLRTQLTNSLAPGNCYYVEFFVNLINNLKYAVNNIGASITNSPVTNFSIGNVLNQSAQIMKFGNPIIKDTLNWTKICGIYQASGNEQYITIGNFKSDAATDTLFTGFYAYCAAYYFIEDVSMVLINPSGNLPWTYNDTTVNLGDSVYIGNYLGGSLTSNWYLQGGGFINSGSGIFVTPTVTSNYIVQYTVCGIPRADTLKVTVTTGVGINEFALKNSEFIVSPNPNNGVINIEIINKEFVFQNSVIKIYDVFNREIKTFKVASKKQSLELQDINSGVYYLQLLQDNKLLLTKKLTPIRLY